MRRLLLLASTLAAACHSTNAQDPRETARAIQSAAAGATNETSASTAAPSGLPAIADAATSAEPRVPDLSDAASPAPASSTPFGPPVSIDRATCGPILHGGPFHAFLSAADTRVAYVDGNDPLALVNRSPTGALPPSYAPSDLVDVRDGSPRTIAQCESAHDCLRRDAAAALKRMFEPMRAEGLRGQVASAFRAFTTQCWTFTGWARQAHAGFCEATSQSALPGHSQHQLGTTVDLFTVEWAEKGARTGQGVFRDGFGCSAGGKWLDENSWRYGFVIPYPIHPDDRKGGHPGVPASRCAPRVDRSVPIDPKTGYKSEPWHLRYIGDEAARRYHDAWLASGPGTPDEIALEQWLRSERGLVGDAELPVCDGCQCGACATLASDDRDQPCGDASLRLDGNGRVVSPDEEPRIVAVRAAVGRGGAIEVDVDLESPAHAPTQPPVTSATGPAYEAGATYRSLAPYPDTAPRAYPDLPGAWRVAVEPVEPGSMRWPWRASLARADLEATWNRANVVLPAKAGASTVHVHVMPASGTEKLHVTLLRDGVEHGTRDVALSP